ncbi:integral membrane protein 2B-like [Conger conger]|uniref:integral membrane protein 2B-like n=1 Tax=Conger conger TaxID=82655 RepID=UPI002A5A6C6D|nr:integral membrane protein 2B-like [Conger conger]
MVKVSFNSSLGQKDLNKEEENSEVLIPESTELQNGFHVRRLFKAWCWYLAILLAGVVLGGAFLYNYFMPQRQMYFCGMTYQEENFMIPEYEDMEVPSRLQDIHETIQVLQDEEVELINVPVPKFSNSDPANIVHDFSMRLTAYLDLRLNKCYVITLNTSIVMPPRDLLEFLENIKDRKYLPQSYLIHEQMMVTEQVDNVDQLGNFIYNLCRGKDTYRLQRRDTILGMQKREALICHKIIHFENTFAVDTKICFPGVLSSSACSQKYVILLVLLNMLFFLGCI